MPSTGAAGETGGRPFRVLFLCTGNSARSILAEALLRRLGGERFCALSAGSHPTGQVNPEAAALLRERGYPTEELRSKSWDEFEAPETQYLDLVVTVCDSAAGEACPVWPGSPVVVHWGLPDPAAVGGSSRERRLAFERAYRELEQRIEGLTALDLRALDRVGLRAALEQIGRSGAPRVTGAVR